jgi:hypothetical protein
MQRGKNGKLHSIETLQDIHVTFSDVNNHDFVFTRKEKKNFKTTDLMINIEN